MDLIKWINFDPNDIYSFHFKLYTITGFWKTYSTSKLTKSLYKFYHLAHEIIFVFYIFSYMVDAYLVRNDIGKLSTNLCYQICVIMQVCKIWSLLLKMKKVDRIHAKLNNNFDLEFIGKSKEDKEIIMKNTKEIAVVTISLLIMVNLLCVIWIVFPFVVYPGESKFMIPFPPYPGVDKSPLFEILYSQQAIDITMLGWNVVSYDTIFWGFLSRICSHFEILAKNFEKMNKLYSENETRSIDEFENQKGKVKEMRSRLNFSNGAADVNEEEWRSKETEKIIKQNIIHHQAILQLIEEINDVYQAPALFHACSCAGIIGAGAYGILASDKLDAEFVQRVGFMVSILFDTFFYCYYGTRLTERSNLVKEALYDSPWYKMEKSPKKLVVFINEKLQKQSEVSALKLFSISLKTYLELLKVSYDVIALLRQTRARIQD